MEEKEVMLLVILSLNAITTCLLVGKITLIEKAKKDTPYDILYQIVYPAIGFCIGTILAYVIKSV